MITALLGMVGTAIADIAPPIGIKNVSTTGVAVAGLEFEGEFEIRVHKAGELSNFQIDGQGWEVTFSTLPTQPIQASEGTIRVSFKAIPTNPDSPIGLSLHYNGRRARTQYEVGPAHAMRKVTPRLLTRVPNSTGLRDGHVAPIQSIPDEGEGNIAGGAVPIRVVGRVVYDRPGNDNSSPLDGDFDDPGDVPPATIGVHAARVDLIDNDDISLELMWTGETDEHGYFDSGDISWDDCDITGCDIPDLILRVSTLADNAVVVRDLDDETYRFSVPEMENFTGTFHDYGVLAPPVDMMPAFHILMNVARARVFGLEQAGLDGDPVITFWPDDSNGGGAWYERAASAIHVSTQRQWRTDTIIHEFGHHHNNSYYASARPDPSYCDAEMDCDTNPPDTCGHCMWCDENAVDAWFEGWANWYADAVTRAYPDRYTFEDGTPFQPLFTRDLESPDACGGGVEYDDRLTTEGFVGALLRDIEDATQDDHDDDADTDPANVITDGVFDSLCIGAGQILFLTYAHDPNTVTEFLSGYLSSFDSQTHLLWPTAFNVGGSDYISMFPADTQPPGAVTVLDSPSHPLGEGGGLACMTFAFEPPLDDVKGANFFSYIVTDDPAGLEPDESADPISPGDNCSFELTVPIFQLGEYYISIKAQDNGGNWSSEWSLFGPFEVLDCNNSGQLDVCDIDCGVTSIPGVCNFGISPCGFSCFATSSDCNGNWEPDECDVASLRSEDCDINGIPDECQDIKHWTGALGNPDDTSWELPGNWEEEAIPIQWNEVCIAADSSGPGVVYREDETLLNSLASHKSFSLNGGAFPWPDLELLNNSFILDDLQMSGNATMKVDTRIYVDGHFYWFDGGIEGNGITEVNGGLSLMHDSVDLTSGDFKLTGGAGVSNGKIVNMHSGATFEIGTQATFSYSGDSYVFYGTNGRVHVRGLFARDSGDATATFFTPLDNDGIMHVMTGELYLAYPGTHTGQFNCDPGTQLTLSASNSVQDFLPASSISTPVIEFAGGTGNIHGAVDITESILGRGGTWTFASDANIVNYGLDVHTTLGRINFEAPTDRAIAFDSVTITSAGESQGSLDFSTGFPVNVGNFSMLKGSLFGSSPINVSDTFTWTNGGFLSGGPITANGPVVINATSSSRTLARTLNITDQANMFSGFSISSNASMNILDSVVFNMQFASGGISGGTINNFGTILRSSGAGQLSIGATMNNAGLIHNQTGTLNMSGGGTHSGQLIADPGTLLKLSGNGHTMESGSTTRAETIEIIAGSSEFHGSLEVTDTMICNGADFTFASDADIIDYGDHLSVLFGTLRLNAPTDRAISFDTVDIVSNFSGYSLHFNTGQPVNINTLTMSNTGSINGSSPIVIADQLTWTNGSFFAGGAIRCNGATTINPTSSARSLHRPLDNYGEMTIRGGFTISPSGPLTNMPGAVIDLQYENGGIGLTGVITNNGTILKTTTVGEASLPNVVNTGIIDIQVGGIKFHTSYSSLTQTAGETILNDTLIEMFLDSRPIYLEGGVLRGDGSVLGDIDNSGGTVSPGFSAGEIQVDDYVQGINGVLEIEIGGADVADHDVLTVAGTATLAGELIVTDIVPFVPPAGESFVILTAGSIVGTFDTETVPPHYEVVYSPTSVTLELAGPSADLNGDGQYDLMDFALFQACHAGPGQPAAGTCAANVDADLDEDGDVDQDDFLLLFVALDQ